MTDIVFNSVHKAFGETKALNGCSFTASLGEVHAIVGENGSGKSTLAKILSGVLMADSGEVSVFGVTPRTPVEAKALGVSTIFQEILVADEASVTDNLFVGADGLWRKSMERAQKRRIASATLQRFTGTAIDPDRLVGDLPLSIKQWVVIARALIAKPRVLILDESSAALDFDGTVRLHEEIRRLRNGGACVIIVTHRIAELIRITDRATVLRDGQAVGQLERAEITEENLLSLIMAREKAAMPRVASGAVTRSRAKPIVRVRGLALARGTPSFDFDLAEGEIVGLTGLDGHGHDDFARVLAGIQPAHVSAPDVRDAGDGYMSVRNLEDASRLALAYISGDRKREGIFPNLSVLENFAIALYPKTSAFGGWLRHRQLAEEFDREARRLAIKVGSKADKITSLSGGNQQKVLIGRALALRPRILVLNDPARGVDIGTKRELYAQLTQFAQQGGAAVYLSSEIEEFPGFCNRVAVFRHGGVFSELSGGAVTEENILAAMFGRRGAVDLDFTLAAAS